MIHTPVAFIVFNRPDLTAQVFARIRAAAPPRLYVIADGPRTADEVILTAETRAVAEQVDWPCTLVKIYSDVNLGCRKRVITGLNEVFDREQEAIILEDDCLPELNFFTYCERLLSKYSSNENIMHISGTNFYPYKIKESYYFTKYPHIWGWATWRRSWELFDMELIHWPKEKIDSSFLNHLLDKQEIEYWTIHFDNCYQKKTNSWSYNWTYTCLKNNSLSICPKDNLISNIGFGPMAKHTITLNKRMAFLNTKKNYLIESHPAEIKTNKKVDKWTKKKIYGIIKQNKLITKIRLIFKYKIKPLFSWKS